MKQGQGGEEAAEETSPIMAELAEVVGKCAETSASSASVVLGPAAMGDETAKCGGLSEGSAACAPEQPSGEEKGNMTSSAEPMSDDSSAAEKTP